MFEHNIKYTILTIICNTFLLIRNELLCIMFIFSCNSFTGIGFVGLLNRNYDTLLKNFDLSLYRRHAPISDFIVSKEIR